VDFVKLADASDREQNLLISRRVLRIDQRTDDQPGGRHIRGEQIVVSGEGRRLERQTKLLFSAGNV